MSTVGQFNSKNPTIKRILKEASELSQNPSPDYHASPLDANLFEWHFTLRGPPSTAYATGLYHGRIVLPTTYPLRPPSFRFLTPSGRFEVNREICLSISGHHEETWQPAWGIRTALVALRAFMDTEAKGQVGGLDCGADVRRRIAGESGAWACSTCGRSNGEIIAEVEAASAEDGTKVEEKVPDELRMAYREDLAPRIQSGESASASRSSEVRTATTTTAVRNQPRRAERTQDSWVDKAIYAVTALLLFLVARRLLSALF